MGAGEEFDPMDLASATRLVQLVLGGIVLFAGRRLFWLFVATVGFLAAFEVTPQVLGPQPEWLLLVVALGVGVLGALLAVGLQYFAVGIAGFLVGGYALLSLGNILGAQLEGVLFATGGVVGALVVLMLFDWSLIVLSAMAGTIALLQLLPHLDVDLKILLGCGLALLGILVQSFAFRRRRA